LESPAETLEERTMTAVAISFNRGTDDNKASNFTVNTSAPGAGDFELRYNLLDASSVAVTKKDVIKFLKATIKHLNEGKTFFSTAVTGTNYTGPQI
jgi:hypothetical protein